MQSPKDNEFGKEVVAYWGPILGNYGERARGKLISYLNEPSVHIELEDGTHLRWAASLCKLLEDDAD